MEEIANKFLSDANFVTYHTSSILDEEVLKSSFPNRGNLSYPAKFFLWRVMNHIKEGYMPMKDIWSDATYCRIILFNKESLFNLLLDTNVDEFIRRVKEQLGIDLSEEDIEKDTIDDIISRRVSDQEFLLLYFGHHPNRDDLFNVVYELFDTELENSNHQSDELPLGSLLYGLFYAQGYKSCYGPLRLVEGNLHLVADEDLNLLRQVYGLDDNLSNEEVIRRIIDEQNKYIVEIMSTEYYEELKDLFLTLSQNNIS